VRFVDEFRDADTAQTLAAQIAALCEPGRHYRFMGRVRDDPPGLVLLKTEFGATRIVDLLIGDPLPRIC
jgi:hydrogenase expression/formation protein HypE